MNKWVCPAWQRPAEPHGRMTILCKGPKKRYLKCGKGNILVARSVPDPC